MEKQISKAGELQGRPGTVWKVFVLGGRIQEVRADQLTRSGTSEVCVTAVRGRAVSHVDTCSTCIIITLPKELKYSTLSGCVSGV